MISNLVAGDTMFERYTENARRVIFFARYECSALGSPQICTEHLLLGLMREAPGITRLHLKLDATDLTQHLMMNLFTKNQPIGTSVDIPLDDGAKRVLERASEEAERLAHTHVGTEHLLLGVLREEHGPAAETLRALGVPTVAEVRKFIAESLAAEARSRSALAIYLVDEATGRQLPIGLSPTALPRLGESIWLAPPAEAPGLYRVIDLQWILETHSTAANPTLGAIHIRVRREVTETPQ